MCIYLFVSPYELYYLYEISFSHDEDRQESAGVLTQPILQYEWKCKWKKINYTFFISLYAFGEKILFITIIHFFLLLWYNGKKKNKKKYKKLKLRWNSYKIGRVVQSNHSHGLYPRTKTVRKGDGKNRQKKGCNTLGYHVTNW